MQKKTRRFERTAASVCKEYAILTLATLVMSAGTYLFKFPNNFSFGGVTGLAVVLSAVSPLSAGTYNFIINMALLVLGFLFLGKGFGVKTVYISVLMSVALSAAEKLFPMSGPLTDQPVLELIFAIAIPGISSAIMFNMGASSGGTDIVAMILLYEYRDRFAGGGSADCRFSLLCVRYYHRFVFPVRLVYENHCH